MFETNKNQTTAFDNMKEAEKVDVEENIDKNNLQKKDKVKLRTEYSNGKNPFYR